MPDTKLYSDDPALYRVETEVIEQGESDGRAWVRLEETIFYPGGGGQPADRGTIAGVKVLDVQPRGAEVLHFVEKPVPPGAVTAALDVARRFDLMQQHTAQHLLTAVLQDRHGLPTTTFHLGETYSAIEVDGPVPSPEKLWQVEDEVNLHVREDRPVRIRWVEPHEMERLPVRTRGLPAGHEGKVRLVEIEGIDLNTCGGTHVGKLSEIQLIHLFRAEAARGGARIHYLAGGRVIRRLREADHIDASLKERMGTAPGEFAGVIDGWQAERRRLGKRIKSLETENADLIAAQLCSSTLSPITRFLPEAGPELLRSLARAVLDRRPEAIVALVGDQGGEACFLVQSGPDGPEDVSGIGQALRDRLGAKGGGKGRTFQGRGGDARKGESALAKLA